MSFEEITENKNLMRITWLTLSLVVNVKEDELLLTLSHLLEEYFLKHDKEWLENWMEAAEKCEESGDPSNLIEMISEAMILNQMIKDLEDNPGLKYTLN